MIKTKIFFGNDHAGENLKIYLINRLENEYKNKYIIKDFGCNNQNKADFPIYAEKVCKSITVKPLNCEPSEIGVVICGSGIGMSIACNRYKHIRCALCYNTEMGKLSRNHNNSNVLALGARFITPEEAFNILDEYLNNFFLGSKYLDRLKLI